MHWTFTIDKRKTGWLIAVFLYKFRELLTHTAFRYRVSCPIFCLMPDHMHLVLIGIDSRSDQLKATKYLRKHLNQILERLDCKLQHQPYDRVLRDDERREDAFTDLVEYIARNPERAGLVAEDEFQSYKSRDALHRAIRNLICFKLIWVCLINAVPEYPTTHSLSFCGQVVS